MKTAVAVSGGADSLYALSVLREEGHDLVALHGLLAPAGSTGSGALPGLRTICARLGIPLHVADLEREFEENVIRPFVAAYNAGLTPNPCARCNAAVKFGLLRDKAEELGALRFATGHYALLETHPHYGSTVRRALDLSRDQSYFLALTPRARLERVVFPLGKTLKACLGGELARRGLEPPVAEESREICFVPGDDYRAFLSARRKSPARPGPARLRDGRVIGRHAGLWRYTEGQRRGIGIAWSEPLYVLEKNTAENALVLGAAGEARVSGCRAGELNLFVPPSLWPENLFVRTRYKQNAAQADAAIEKDTMRVAFHAPQIRPAPGQVAAVYDQDGFLLAGGVIGKDE